jgi:hypothetical protein
MPRSELPRLAILGGGPIGLEAALHAASLRLPFTLYERGRVGEYYHHWGHVRLFSPFEMNSSPLGRAHLRNDCRQDLPRDKDVLTGREHLAAYLEPLAASSLLRDHVRTQTAVLHVSRKGFLKEDALGDPRRALQPFRLLLRGGKNEAIEEADVVLDCTGTYGQPRFLGEGGIPALGELASRPHIAAGLEDVLGERRAAYADKTILVLGSGYSAATTVCNLARLAEKHPGTWILWAVRSVGTQPIKRFVNDALRERDQLAVRANTLATRGEGNVEFHPQVSVEAVECAGADRGFKVRAFCAGKPVTWEVDRLVATVGYMPAGELYRELQVNECPASQGPRELSEALLKQAAGESSHLSRLGSAVLRHPEPNFYILGAKSYGRYSNFLVRVGLEQVRDVFALITGQADMRNRFPGLRQLPKLP